MEVEIKKKKTNNTKFVDAFSEEIYNQTYRYGEENINETHYRVAKDLAIVEKDSEYWTNKFLYALEDFKFVPGGRITSNAGTGLKGTTYINCFTPETEVLTKTGYKQIKDIKVNDSVLTHLGRWRKVKSLIKNKYNGILDVYDSSVLTDKLKSTPEHSFYQGNNNWVKSKDNEQLTLLNYVDVSKKITLDLYEYVKDIVHFNINVDIFYNDNIIHTTSEHNFHNGSVSTKTSVPINRFIEVDEKTAYTFGRFVGDGSTFDCNGNYEVDGFNIAFSNKEQNEMVSIKENLETVFGIDININKSNIHDCVYLRKNNILLAEFLKNAFGRNSYTKTIPSFIWDGPKNIIEKFLLGLYDADGTVTTKQELRIGLNNYKLIKDVQALMNMIGYSGRITNTSTEKYKSWQLFINKNIGKSFIEKMNKYYNDDRLSTIKITNNGLSPIVDISTNTEKIHKINGHIKTQEKYDGYVYNISVDEDESYVVNNVVVHNCFVDGFIGTNQDSMLGILSALQRQALILKSEGGYGFCADTMRPCGAYVNGIGSESPGAVRMLDMWDTQSAVITAGSGTKTKNKKGKQKIRKGAQMVTMSVWHPDIEEYITSKQTPGRLTKFNMSLLVSDDFMDAVKNHKPWDLIFPDYEKNIEAYDNEWDGNIQKWINSGYATVVYKTFEDANELWDLIMKSTYNRNEPGILFSDTMNKMNNLYYCEHISATNPCVIGETLVTTNKGKIRIDELVKRYQKGEKFKVQSYNIETNELEYKDVELAIKTKDNAEVIKLTLENNETITLTPDHKVFTENRGWIEASNLTEDDILLMIE